MLPSFFERSPAPPALHSFPTRRSSDLDDPRDGDAPRARDCAPLQTERQWTPHRATWADRHREGHPTVRVPLRNRADRKSTRLNSSHMSISYAVFCLKKKKNTSYTCP